MFTRKIITSNYSTRHPSHCNKARNEIIAHGMLTLTSLMETRPSSLMMISVSLHKSQIALVLFTRRSKHPNFQSSHMRKFQCQLTLRYLPVQVTY